MKTMVEVKKAGPGSADIHEVEGEPEGISNLVNGAIKQKHRFVTFRVPEKKQLGVIAENVTAIWQE